MGKYTAKFIILWRDNFGENHTPLQRNGMTAIPKRSFCRVNNLIYSMKHDLHLKDNIITC